jgi:hypothetical protein
MFQTKIVEKIKRDILYSITFFETHAVYGIMSKKTALALKYGARTRQSQRDGETHTHGHAHKNARTHARARLRERTHKYVIFIAFFQQQGFVNAFQCYVIRPLLFFFFPLSSVFVQRRVNITCKLRPYLIKTLCLPLQKLTNLLRLVT